MFAVHVFSWVTLAARHEWRSCHLSGTIHDYAATLEEDSFVAVQTVDNRIGVVKMDHGGKTRDAWLWQRSLMDINIPTRTCEIAMGFFGLEYEYLYVLMKPSACTNEKAKCLLHEFVIVEKLTGRVRGSMVLPFECQCVTFDDSLCDNARLIFHSVTQRHQNEYHLAYVSHTIPLSAVHTHTIPQSFQKVVSAMRHIDEAEDSPLSISSIKASGALACFVALGADRAEMFCAWTGKCTIIFSSINLTVEPHVRIEKVTSASTRPQGHSYFVLFSTGKIFSVDVSFLYGQEGMKIEEVQRNAVRMIELQMRSENAENLESFSHCIFATKDDSHGPLIFRVRNSASGGDEATRIFCTSEGANIAIAQQLKHGTLQKFRIPKPVIFNTTHAAASNMLDRSSLDESCTDSFSLNEVIQAKVAWAGSEEVIILLHTGGNVLARSASTGLALWQISLLEAEVGQKVSYSCVHTLDQRGHTVFAVIGYASVNGHTVRAYEVDVVNGDSRALHAIQIVDGRIHADAFVRSKEPIATCFPVKASSSTPAGIIVVLQDSTHIFFPTKDVAIPFEAMGGSAVRFHDTHSSHTSIRVQVRGNHTLTSYDVRFREAQVRSARIPAFSFPALELHLAWRFTVPRSSLHGYLQKESTQAIDFECQAGRDTPPSPLYMHNTLRHIPLQDSPDISEIYRKLSFRGMEVLWWMRDKTLWVSVFDGASGATLYSAQHRALPGRIRMCAAENTLLYSFTHAETLEPTLVAVEALRTIFAGKHGNTLLSNQMLSPFDMFRQKPKEDVEQRRFVAHQHTLPEPVLDIAVTRSRHGLSSKHVVLVFRSGAVAHVPLEETQRDYPDANGRRVLVQRSAYVPGVRNSTKVVACFASAYESGAKLLLAGADLSLHAIPLGVPFDRMREDISYPALLGTSVLVALWALWLHRSSRGKVF